MKVNFQYVLKYEFNRIEYKEQINHMIIDWDEIHLMDAFKKFIIGLSLLISNRLHYIKFKKKETIQQQKSLPEVGNHLSKIDICLMLI